MIQLAEELTAEQMTWAKRSCARIEVTEAAKAWYRENSEATLAALVDAVGALIEMEGS